MTITNETVIAPGECKSIGDVRSGIDAIDFEIVRLLARRSEYVARAASFKNSEEEVEAKGRVESALEDRRRWGDSLGIDGDFISKLYSSIIDHFVRQEKDRWRIHGAQR